MTAAKQENNHPVSIPGTLSTFTDLWSPRLVAAVNDSHVKVAKIEGAFEFHSHGDSDELFYILEGSMVMEEEVEENSNSDENREKQQEKKGEKKIRSVILNQGDVYVVKRGVRHRPVAADREKGGARILMVERNTTVNTGDEGERGDEGLRHRTRVPVDVRSSS